LNNLFRAGALILLLASSALAGAPAPHFRVSQVVATTVTETPEYFRIGFIARHVDENGKARHVDENGKVFYWYTENTTDYPPYWSESVLRPLTPKECRR
jgi:hypothetical protein